MQKIVFFDTHGGDSRYFKQALKNLFKYEVVTTPQPLNETTVTEYADAAIVSVFVTSAVTAKVVAALPQLELIAARSTGYDHIDLAAAAHQHTLVSVVPSYGDKTVAEYTFMLLLSVMRRLDESQRQIELGVIKYRELIGSDLNGKTIGLIGCGQIGRQVAKIARGFEMEVIGFDINSKESEHINYRDFDTVIAESDIISLHLPATKQTRHIIDKSVLEKMKSGVVILNTARGELIDTSALIEALYSGRVGAAGLDVVEGENLLRREEEIALLHPEARMQDLVHQTEHSVLLRMPQVVLTPHNAFNSREALARIRQTTSENIKQFLLHSPQNIVKP
ncbi:MAG: NAD(P)-dependent oxidoreductase [Candidatus Saccharimonadales bacterium]